VDPRTTPTTRTPKIPSTPARDLIARGPERLGRIGGFLGIDRMTSLRHLSLA